MTYTQPLLLICIGMSAWGLAKRNQKLVLAGLVGVLLATWGPAGWLFSRPLEWQYAGIRMPQQRAQAIVVLSGGIEAPKVHCPIAMPDESTFARCRYAGWLYKHWQQAPVLLSGGMNAGSKEPFAATMAEVIGKCDVPADQIWMETRSRNTYENARYSAEILRSKGVSNIVLVVEADTMLRAEGCFRKQGITVVPAPFNHRSFGTGVQDFIPCWTALQRNERTLHEYGGLL
jgi:uncharacterized SAM-binding protein YcdF (DUF218 family)